MAGELAHDITLVSGARQSDSPFIYVAMESPHESRQAPVTITTMCHRDSYYTTADCVPCAATYLFCDRRFVPLVTRHLFAHPSPAKRRLVLCFHGSGFVVFVLV